MDFKDSIRAALSAADFISGAYLSDLTQSDLLVRPVPGSNHVAWQWGHLIGAERHLAELAAPGLMPALPVGFAEAHGKESANADDPAKFLKKEQYIQIAKEIRVGTLRVIGQIDPADMDQPISGKAPPFVKRRGEALTTIPGHWLLHAGQWAILRRTLGRPKLF